MELALFVNFLVALALGSLIGLEREYATYKKRGHDFAGIRTFPLISLFGAITAYLGMKYSVWIFISGMVITGVLIIMAYKAISNTTNKHIGITSEVSAFLTFLIGALTFYNELNLAVVLTVGITIILFARSFLHQFAKKLQPKELASTLKFAVIAFVILPFLPNKGYGPMEIFNPYIVWLMVVFISGIGFFGYILMKWYGEKGIPVAGFLGGVISGTATTIAFAERSKKTKKIYRALSLGVVLAISTMILTTLVEVFILNQKLFWEILPAFIILLVGVAVISYVVYKRVRNRNVPGKIDLGSPFTLKPALKFGIFFAIVLALVKVSNYYFQSRGVYLVSFISGFAGTDPITVSLANLSKDVISLETAKKGILLATLTNFAVKGGIAYWLGGKEFGRMVAVCFAILIAIGIPLLFFI